MSQEKAKLFVQMKIIRSWLARAPKNNQLSSVEQICLQVSQVRGSPSEKASALTKDELEPNLCLHHLLPFCSGVRIQLFH